MTTVLETILCIFLAIIMFMFCFMIHSNATEIEQAKEIMEQKLSDIEIPEINKKVAKKAAELAAIRDQDSITKEQLAEIEAKHQRLLEVNKDLISKLSTFFSSDNSMENFLEYCNDMIVNNLKTRV